MQLKIKFNWQKRAIILFASSILVLSIILTIFAIREAEREKLIREKERDEEQQRSIELIANQVNSIILYGGGAGICILLAPIL
ncbi:MAG: hypothetical protein WBC02_10120 [Candidatus Aminicenantaceae bacterium]